MHHADVLLPQIQTYHQHLTSPLPSSPNFHFHLTRLKDTLFIWVGAGPASGTGGAGGFGGSGREDDDEDGGGAMERRVGSDWAVGMPARGNIPVSGTPIFQPGSSGLSVSMVQRFTRKFPPNQIHLSLSLPASMTAQSGPSLDPLAGRTLLVMERELVKWIQGILAPETD